MIRYALICSDCDHDFEAWFASSAAFDDQSGRGLVSCAMCSGVNVAKQIMAPSVRTSENRKSEPLREEGVPAAPLPRALTPPLPKSDKQLN